MRIIAGTKRGMHLLSPKTNDSRPITDRVKESLFSVLYRYDLPADAIVADVFSGVGSLGLEALSRGAKFVTFVEQDPKIAATLNQNIEKAGFIKESKVVRANAFRVGAPVAPAHPSYDLVFVDPPYVRSKKAGPDSLLAGLMDVMGSQVRPEGLAVVRVEEHTTLLDQYGQFNIVDRRHWSSMIVGIYRNGGQ